MRGRRRYLVGAVVVAAVAGATPAQADHHLVKVSEVFPGSDTSPSLEYVELQMVASGQNLFDGTNASVDVYSPTANVLSAGLGTDLANGQNNRRILVGSQSATPGNDVLGTFGKMPNFAFSDSGYLNPAGGAVCFLAPEFSTGDCVSWGNFSGSLPFPTGGNAGAITGNQALARKGPACGPGVIDTDNPSDLTLNPPAPNNNADPAAAGTPCPNTILTRKPRKKTTKRLAKFEFTGTLGNEFVCKLDDAPFRDCSSPFQKRVKVGKHAFKVRVSGDPSPAAYSWKVVRKR
jgi:hypothetical protein